MNSIFYSIYPDYIWVLIIILTSTNRIELLTKCLTSARRLLHSIVQSLSFRQNNKHPLFISQQMPWMFIRTKSAYFALDRQFKFAPHIIYCITENSFSQRKRKQPSVTASQPIYIVIHCHDCNLLL